MAQIGLKSFMNWQSVAKVSKTDLGELKMNGGPGEIWTLDLSVISRTL
jgi:hypothetical protein